MDRYVLLPSTSSPTDAAFREYLKAASEAALATRRDAAALEALVPPAQHAYWAALDAEAQS